MFVPTIIAARNEAGHIGHTLEALARQAQRVEPIVVINSCTDRTADIAQSAGAIVLESPEGKMPALQEGLHYLGRRALEPLLILDADSRPFTRHWSRCLTHELGNMPAEHPRIAWGPYIFLGDINPAMGLFFSATAMRVSWADRHDSDPRAIRGGNTSIALTKAPVLEEFLAMPNYWPREDVAIFDNIMQHEGVHKVIFHPDAWATTSGARLATNIKRIITKCQNPTKVYDESYEREAPSGSTPYIATHSKRLNKNPGASH